MRSSETTGGLRASEELGHVVHGLVVARSEEKFGADIIPDVVAHEQVSVAGQLPHEEVVDLDGVTVPLGLDLAVLVSFDDQLARRVVHEVHAGLAVDVRVVRAAVEQHVDGCLDEHGPAFGLGDERRVLLELVDGQRHQANRHALGVHLQGRDQPVDAIDTHQAEPVDRHVHDLAVHQRELLEVVQILERNDRVQEVGTLAIGEREVAGELGDVIDHVRDGHDLGVVVEQGEELDAAQTLPVEQSRPLRDLVVRRLDAHPVGFGQVAGNEVELDPLRVEIRPAHDAVSRDQLVTERLGDAGSLDNGGHQLDGRIIGLDFVIYLHDLYPFLKQQTVGIPLS